MLKIIRGLVSVLAVLVGSAYVTPTYASSAPIVIDQVRPATELGEENEYIVLRNTTKWPVDISNWCLSGSEAPNFICFDPGPSGVSLVVAPLGYIVVTSEDYAENYGTHPSFTYTLSNIFLGLSSTQGGSLHLLNEKSITVDSLDWPTFVPSSYQLQRLNSPGVVPSGIILGSGDDAWVYAEPQTLPEDGVIEEYLPKLRLNEMLPNPKGLDENNEFIELYNYGHISVNLSSYSLRSGKSLEKNIKLPDVTILPGEYYILANSQVSFSLLNSSSKIALYRDGQIVSETEYENPKDDMAWTFSDDGWFYSIEQTPGMLNVSPPQGTAVEDATDGGDMPDAGDTADGGDTADDPDGEDATPISTLKPCAEGQERNPETNRCRKIPEEDTGLKPCAEGQYRNPETNRCKNIESSGDSSPKPCAEGQERNPETNRCRKIASEDSAGLQPCKEGQYRNPETNRCKNIESSSDSSPKPCAEGQERNPETNRCRNIKKISDASGAVLGVDEQSEGDITIIILTVAAIVVAVGSYAVWEWRVELKSVWLKIIRRGGKTGL